MKKGFTLLEALVVVAMFTFLLAGLFAVLTSSDRSWQTNRDKLIEQQQARRGIDQMVRLLRQSNSCWSEPCAADPYKVVVSDGNGRIDFYNPVFDAQGVVTGLKKVTFKMDPLNPNYLLKKEGVANSVIIAKDVWGVAFSPGCAGCVDFIACPNCSIVNMQLTSRKQANFTISTQVTLRNENLSLPGSAVIEEPAQGEF